MASRQKRPPIDTNYFETFNRDNILLVDLKQEPVVEITEKGIKTTEREYELDIIVFATGFDALTGPLLALNITGSKGYELKEDHGKDSRHEFTHGRPCPGVRVAISAAARREAVRGAC
jgi:cation diffusion facilitator CzcD-associated flavoprotein CzcO